MLRNFIKRLVHGVSVGAGAVFLTFLFFMVLPLIQQISEKPEPEYLVREVFTTDIPPPPPPPEEKPEEKEEEPEENLELQDQQQEIDLSALELALNPGFGEGWGTGDFGMSFDKAARKGKVKELFSLAELDQRPRATYKPQPAFGPKQRRKAPGRVVIVFVVNERGRVENPVIQESTDPVFTAPALAAIRKWRFEPGKRNGEPVRFRMRQPITFPKG